MANFKLKRGYDIPISGRAEKKLLSTNRPELVAVQPPDFRTLKPKVMVEPNDTVKAGSVLFVDKRRPEIKFASPVSGTVVEINRGDRRAIMSITVKPDASDTFVEFKSWNHGDIKSASGDAIKTALVEAGLWPTLRERPYAKIPSLTASPKAIFISAVDSAPLSADTSFLLDGKDKEFQAGVWALQKLTDGKIHLSSSNGNSSFFSNIEGIEKHIIDGPHPAGNIGVQVFHIDRLRPNETIWYVSPTDVARMGTLLLTGKYPNEVTIALTGSNLEHRGYVKTIQGAQISSIIKETVLSNTSRVISGDVLTGTQSSMDGFIGYYANAVAVIPEVQTTRFMGWANPGFKLSSFMRTHLSFLRPNAKYEINTDLNGEERAFVATGHYEKVMPMDILPTHLCKSILIEDIEQMEKLGIYEVDSEDFALCTYIDPSKIEFGEIINKGIELMEKEG